VGPDRCCLLVSSQVATSLKRRGLARVHTVCVLTTRQSTACPWLATAIFAAAASSSAAGMASASVSYPKPIVVPPPKGGRQGLTLVHFST